MSARNLTDLEMSGIRLEEEVINENLCMMCMVYSREELDSLYQSAREALEIVYATHKDRFVEGHDQSMQVQVIERCLFCGQVMPRKAKE